MKTSLNSGSPGLFRARAWLNLLLCAALAPALAGGTRSAQASSFDDEAPTSLVQDETPESAYAPIPAVPRASAFNNEEVNEAASDQLPPPAPIPTRLPGVRRASASASKDPLVRDYPREAPASGGAPAPAPAPARSPAYVPPEPRNYFPPSMGMSNNPAPGTPQPYLNDKPIVLFQRTPEKHARGAKLRTKARPQATAPNPRTQLRKTRAAAPKTVAPRAPRLSSETRFSPVKS